ncbi:DeoR/GlpR family transcriptional regulator [Agromyces sp. ISL-38]|uniref:substrate-binding domain-containing protein n=1 Tax=Agromyces sp. ISL-38 TaxID=2819107 RepID=UPI001BEB1DEB|nr:substrate-binding domain-containing protein [Agromyces sp. ISL-38]MBT2500613.1 DeoR/GlpR family transcriptional regulator [Agromyces sp. ISL-38]
MSRDGRAAPAFGIERRERIMDEIRRAGKVVVRDLAVLLGVTELTIRRDIAELADRGLVTRVHGGATLRSSLDTSVARAADASGPSRFRLGMVVPSLSYYWPQIVNGARATAALSRSQLVLRGSTYDPADQRRQIAALVEAGGIHGLIAAPETSGQDGYSLLAWLDSLPIPVVLAERRAPTALALRKLEWVTTDHEFGAILAVHHLYQQGHRRIGIAIARHSPTSGHLRRGWARAHSELGLDSSLTVDTVLDDIENGHRDARLDEVLDRCLATGTTAIMIHSDPQAILLEHRCFDRGIRIPEDLAIVAYDDEIAENGEPPITALRPPKQHIGRLAVETLLARLSEGPKRPMQRVQVLPELHVRASSTSAEVTGG